MLAAEGDASGSSSRLCDVSMKMTGATGAGVMLMSGDMPRGTLCTTDDVSLLIEDLQYTFGEGPCVDAYTEDRAVVAPDFALLAHGQWTAFAPPVIEAGVRAMFAFPLRVGTVRLGALNLYRDRVGPLTGDQHSDGWAMADIAARWVLDSQAGAPPGTIAEQLDRGADLHFSVHNAAGMVSVQLGVGVAEAIVRLRGYAFSHERPIRDVAEDVITGRVRFD